MAGSIRSVSYADYLNCQSDDVRKRTRPYRAYRPHPPFRQLRWGITGIVRTGKNTANIATVKKLYR